MVTIRSREACSGDHLLEVTSRRRCVGDNVQSGLIQVVMVFIMRALGGKW